MTEKLTVQGGSPRRMRSIGRGCPLFVHALLLVLLLFPVSECRALTYYSLPPFPTGRLLYAQPTVRWTVWPVDGYRVTSVRMTLNGKRVPARYAAADRAAVYVPTEPLSPGEYSVHCAVMLDDENPLERDWRFTVAPSALLTLPEPDYEPQRALDAANRFRATVGLPDMRLDSRLCASADSHARYLDTNGEFGHFETPGHYDFVGRDLLERSAAFGYWGGGYEDVSYGSVNSLAAIQHLLDAPYHRLPFMQPGSPDFGMGRAGKQTALEFGLTRAEAVVVYPATDQTGVPRSWSGNEDPDPLRLHGVSGRTGYILTYAYFSPEPGKIRVQKATLRDALGDEVRCFLNTPTNDSHLPNGVFLIPADPLRPVTTYTAEVRATNASGRDISRRWSFTTGR